MVTARVAVKADIGAAGRSITAQQRNFAAATRIHPAHVMVQHALLSPDKKPRRSCVRLQTAGLKLVSPPRTARRGRPTPNPRTKENNMNPTKTFALLAIMSALAACSSTPIKETPPAAPVAAQPVAQAPAPMLPAESKVTEVALPAYLDPNNPISTQRSVFFDFDNYSIKSEYDPVIERHGKYLTTQPSLAVKLEGNSDERGGAEYNLALGQKRAEAVLKALKVYGVNDSQMEAVSWGKERPKALGHDEAAWSQNRRVDIMYPKS
jgi:peptidoglycan-associated lipoprotein